MTSSHSPWSSSVVAVTLASMTLRSSSETLDVLFVHSIGRAFDSAVRISRQCNEEPPRIQIGRWPEIRALIHPG